MAAAYLPALPTLSSLAPSVDPVVSHRVALGREKRKTRKERERGKESGKGIVSGLNVVKKSPLTSRMAREPGSLKDGLHLKLICIERQDRVRTSRSSANVETFLILLTSQTFSSCSMHIVWTEILHPAHFLLATDFCCKMGTDRGKRTSNRNQLLGLWEDSKEGILF